MKYFAGYGMKAPPSATVTRERTANACRWELPSYPREMTDATELLPLPAAGRVRAREPGRRRSCCAWALLRRARGRRRSIFGGSTGPARGPCRRGAHLFDRGVIPRRAPNIPVFFLIDRWEWDLIQYTFY